MIDNKNLKVDVFTEDRTKGMHPAETMVNFVKIEHIPSRIVVTKAGRKSQLKVKNECMKELEILVGHWDRGYIE